MPDPYPSAIDVGLLCSAEHLRPVCRRIWGTFEFTTSLGLDDKVPSHLIVESDIAVDIVTLGPGRLFPEKYELCARSETRQGLRINGFSLLRAAQAAARSTKRCVACDPTHDLPKANPLRDRTRGQAAGFAPAQDIPVNPLHHRGFLSISCAPFTRAIATGEMDRAGGRWWEEDETPECSKHLKDGRIVPAGA